MQFIIFEENQAKGYIVESESLSYAKQQASKNQIFQGATLKIKDITGDLVAIKTGKHWQDLEPMGEPFTEWEYLFNK